MRILNYLLLAFIVIVLVFYMFSMNKTYHIISGKSMGTYYNVKIKSNSVDNMLNTDVQDLLDTIVAKNSVFDSSSEISKINQDHSGEWIKLSPEMSEIMKKAYKIYEISDGAFDPTVGSLVDLWGFGSKKVSKLPKDEEISKVLKYTGFDKVNFSKDFLQIRKTDPNIYINLSAIVKGYGVDKVAELLIEKGYVDFIVEIGGEVRASGGRVEGILGWNLGVLSPQKEKAENAFVISLKNFSAATSGDYRNYYDIDGNIFSHTIDPKTGWPVVNNISSVTVLHEKCMDADALATALIAMGQEKALKFANKKKLVAFIFIKSIDGGSKLVMSDKAKTFLSKNSIAE